MLKRLILFLIRRKLKIRKYVYFRFVNQRNPDMYIFTTQGLVKFPYYMRNAYSQGTMSKISLRWLLDDECKTIEMIGGWDNNADNNTGSN